MIDDAAKISTMCDKNFGLMDNILVWKQMR